MARGNQWSREDVSEHGVVVLARGERDRVRQDQPVADVVPLRVLSGGAQGLRIDVNADRRSRAELQRGDCEYAGAAAEVQHRVFCRWSCVQVFQIESGGRVGARPEGQPRVQGDDDRILGIDAATAGLDSEACTETHRRKVLEPRTLPVTVIEYAPLAQLCGVIALTVSQWQFHEFGRDSDIEQCRGEGLWLQSHLTWPRFQHRSVSGITSR